MDAQDLREKCGELGLNFNTVRQRIEQGLPVKKALSIPPHGRCYVDKEEERIRRLCKTFDVKYVVVQRHMRKGLSVEQAIDAYKNRHAVNNIIRRKYLAEEKRRGKLAAQALRIQKNELKIKLELLLQQKKSINVEIYRLYSATDKSDKIQRRMIKEVYLNPLRENAVQIRATKKSLLSRKFVGDDITVLQ